MIKVLLKLHHLRGDARAASRGPKALSKRLLRRAAHKLVYKILG
jgi:hypothetical protein